MNKKCRNFNVQLDKEEQELLESVELGEWQTVKNLKEEIARATVAAKNYLKKRKTIAKGENRGQD